MATTAVLILLLFAAGLIQEALPAKANDMAIFYGLETRMYIKLQTVNKDYSIFVPWNFHLTQKSGSINQHGN